MCVCARSTRTHAYASIYTRALSLIHIRSLPRSLTRSFTQTVTHAPTHSPTRSRANRHTGSVHSSIPLPTLSLLHMVMPLMSQELRMHKPCMCIGQPDDDAAAGNAGHIAPSSGVCVCVFVCVRACVRACVRVCMHACNCASALGLPLCSISLSVSVSLFLPVCPTCSFEHFHMYLCADLTLFITPSRAHTHIHISRGRERPVESEPTLSHASCQLPQRAKCCRRGSGKLSQKVVGAYGYGRRCACG